MDNIIIRTLKRVSALKQTSASSFKRHNGEFEMKNEEEIAAVRSELEKMDKSGFMDIPENKFGQILAKYPTVRHTAVDIGSGAGWLSAKLAGDYKFVEVMAIDPSPALINVAKGFYPAEQYPAIKWVRGFAEDVLSNLNFTEPVFFFTGCVLSHLRDKEAARICEAVNKISPIGSVLSFGECWGTEWHQYMWHVRTKEWWQRELPGWELDFHGPNIQEVPGRHKGFHGVKK